MQNIVVSQQLFACSNCGRTCNFHFTDIHRKGAGTGFTTLQGKQLYNIFSPSKKKKRSLKSFITFTKLGLIL